MMSDAVDDMNRTIDFLGDLNAMAISIDGLLNLLTLTVAHGLLGRKLQQVRREGGAQHVQ